MGSKCLSIWEHYLAATCNHHGIRFVARHEDYASRCVAYRFTDLYGVANAVVYISDDEFMQTRDPKGLLEAVIERASSQIDEWLEEHAEG